MLQKQEKYMRVRTDSEFNNMSREQIITGLKNINEFEINDENRSLEKLLKKLMKYERTRSLSLWHDGSTLSNHGHLLMMVACLYDPAVLLTDDECKEKYYMEVNVQSEVEKTELYMLAQCQFNDNQLLYSEERVDLLEINTPITSSNGVLRWGGIISAGYVLLKQLLQKILFLARSNHFCPCWTEFQRF